MSQLLGKDSGVTRLAWTIRLRYIAKEHIDGKKGETLYKLDHRCVEIHTTLRNLTIVLLHILRFLNEVCSYQIEI